MRSIEMTGKTVDIAIFNGLQQLGLSIDEVTIEILQTETKGILGFGAKPAKVRLTEKPQEEVVIPDFEAERSQRERREKRKDEVRNRKDEHRDDRRDDNREHRKGERVRQGQEQAKASEDTSVKPDQQTAAETVRRRPEKKKPYRNVNEMLAAMGSSVDSELDENFPVDESLGEATSLGNGSSGRYGNSRYDSDLFSSNASEKDAETAKSAYTAEPSESAYSAKDAESDEPANPAESAEPSEPAPANEQENDDGKHISSIVREAERYAQSLEDAESYRKKPSKNYQRNKGNNRNNKGNKGDFRNNRIEGSPDRKNPKFKQDNDTSENTKAVMLPESEVNYTEEAAVGNPAAEFVKSLVEHMCIEAKVLAACDADAIRLRIDSDAMGALIGHRGETLDSIQYLTALVINRNRKEEGYTRVTINTEDYREKREETLTKLAKRVAQQVRNTGRARVLEPMNPYERRILHSALQNNPFVLTHSEGEEPNRRVVVTPKRRNRGYNNRRYDNKRGYDNRERNHTVRGSEDRNSAVRESEGELHTPAFTPANPAVPAVEQVTE